jgi:hypothetical protein
MNVSDVKQQVREHDRLVGLRTKLDAAIAKAMQGNGTVTFEVKVTHTEADTGRASSESAAITVSVEEAYELLSVERDAINASVQSIESTFSLI